MHFSSQALKKNLSVPSLSSAAKLFSWQSKIAANVYFYIDIYSFFR